jgi:mono/diheme cytochrome c family protein
MKGLGRCIALAALVCSGAVAVAQEAKDGKEAQHPDTAKALQVCKGKANNTCVVRYLKKSAEASVVRGRAVFQNYCILCHGTQGTGDGRAAKLHAPPPFNLTTSLAPREYIEQMIRKGGEAMGRGKGMPPWGEQLTDEQLADVINYLFTIRK